MTQLIARKKSVKALLTVTKISFTGLFAGETNILPVCYELIDAYSFSVTSLILLTQSMHKQNFSWWKWRTTTEVQEQIFLGGDQLTEERARNAKDARGDGDSSCDRLGVISKIEDWHAIRLAYQVRTSASASELCPKSRFMCLKHPQD